MKTITCLIVDDEPLAVSLLQSHIEQCPGLEWKHTCKNALEALNYLQKHTIDLVFLDIQMPKLTGIELLKSVKNLPPVILTTAYEEYALESYELNVVDYLLKPITLPRFFKAIQKIPEIPVAPIVPSEPKEPVSEEPFLLLKSAQKTFKVFLKEILYAESREHYLKVHTFQQTYVVYQSIGVLADSVPEHLMLRIHRSYLVALDKIDAYSSTMVEVQGQELPIGPSYKALVTKVLNKYLKEL